MTRLSSGLLCVLLWLSPAYAGTGTITTKDAGAVTRTFDVITDGSGNFGSVTAICDGAAIANCLTVKAASTAAVATDLALVTRTADGGDVSLGAKADAHSCSSASAIACLGQIDDDVKTGASATGSAVPAGAIYEAGLASSSEPTKATTGNLTGVLLDLAGKVVTSPFSNRESQLQCAVTITASTAATTCTGMGAQGASVKIYVTDVTCTRNDAGTTAVTMTMNDGATTPFDMPNNGGGGGFSHTYNTPLVVAANTAFQFTSGTSITSEHCSATGFKGY